MTSRVHREPKAVKLGNVSVSPRLEWSVDATPAGCGLLQALFLLRTSAAKYMRYQLQSAPLTQLEVL